jgi:hypothetical protein
MIASISLLGVAALVVVAVGLVWLGHHLFGWFR